MKHFRKICLTCLSILLLAIIVNFVLPAKNNNKKSNAEILDNSVFEFISISKQGQKLTNENFKTIDDTTYIVSNGALTINVSPLNYNYFFDSPIDTNIFYVEKQNVTLNYDTEISNFPQSFTFSGTTYYYRIETTTGMLRIYKDDPAATPTASPIVTSAQSSLIEYVDDLEAQTRTLTFTMSITLKASASDTSLTFSMRSGSTRTYTLNFLRPVINFANAENPVVEFHCNGLDAGDSEYVDNTIRREQSYKNVKINFLNNNYTEGNPLYFDINYNGFIYNFELFSKTIDGEELLFVNYIDTENNENNEYLATALIADSSGELVVDTYNRIYKMNGSNFNIFSLVFDKTGRYEIDFYDSTYKCGLSNPNYYSTSFYIKDENMTPFENIYIIAQTFDDDNTPLEYIVSTSTLNYNVKAIIKNLGNFGKNSAGEQIKLEDILDKVEVKKTTFGGSTNIPTRTNYSATEILANLANNNEFVLSFDEDAYYQITIYQKNSSKTIYFEFTIVKHAKTTFTIPLVDSEGKPIFDENGKQKTDTYEAKTPYKTEIINYNKNILSSMNLSTSFSVNSSTIRNKLLDKTFINKYTISYGMQQVSIEKYEKEKDDNDKSNTVSLNLRFYGVGNMKVYVTFNGTTTEYELNSENGINTLEFTDYGTYTVRVVDSMGTESTQIFALKKSLNFSAMALIILSSIIAAVVVLFILRARSKVGTR